MVLDFFDFILYHCFPFILVLCNLSATVEDDHEEYSDNNDSVAEEALERVACSLGGECLIKYTLLLLILVVIGMCVYILCVCALQAKL